MKDFGHQLVYSFLGHCVLHVSKHNNEAEPPNAIFSALSANRTCPHDFPLLLFDVSAKKCVFQFQGNHMSNRKYFAQNSTAPEINLLNSVISF